MNFLRVSVCISTMTCSLAGTISADAILSFDLWRSSSIEVRGDDHTFTKLELPTEARMIWGDGARPSDAMQSIGI